MPPVPSFDVVHCALVLHHFSDDSDAARALAQMSKLARKGVVVNDLHRNLFAYSAIWILTRVFSRSRILQNDAPLSVARAFTRQELLQLAGTAGLSGVRIKWQWAFRWMMTADKWG
jgi:2-polyprenyl-3-methyl-5-hydroxy-6-metoxy-1,4-benzoquinol methylase